MKMRSLPTAIAMLLALTAAAHAADDPDHGPTGFSNATESAGSKGETGASADCPIKKTVDGKTVCFQNDPALNKPQGGH